MPTYTFQCDECGSSTEEFYKYSERPETIQCACGGKASHTITAVGLMVKEAYLDGTKRKGFADLKEASKLNKEKARARDDSNRRELAAEIRKMGVKLGD